MPMGFAFFVCPTFLLQIRAKKLGDTAKGRKLPMRNRPLDKRLLMTTQNVSPVSHTTIDALLNPLQSAYHYLHDVIYECSPLGVVAHARIFDDGRQIACAVEREVKIFEISSGQCRLVLTGPHVASVSAVEIIYNQDDNRRLESHSKKEVNYISSISSIGLNYFLLLTPTRVFLLSPFQFNF